MVGDFTSFDASKDVNQSNPLGPKTLRTHRMFKTVDALKEKKIKK